MLREQASARNQVSPPQGPSNQLLSIPGDDDDESLGAASPPWWRRRGGIITIAIILLIIVLGAILISLLNRPKPVTYQYSKATQGNIALTVSATGPLQSSTYNLIFEGSGGKIVSINTKVGDKVKQGQVLAQLDKTLLQDTFNQDRSTVNSDQSKLNAALVSSGASSGNAAASVAAAQTSLSNAQAALNKTQSVSNESITADRAALDNARTSLNNAKNVANATTSNASATRNQSLATCNNQATATAVAKQPTPTPVPTAKPTTAPTPVPTAKPTVAPTPKPTAYHRTSGGGPALVFFPASTCTTAAQDTYNQAVASANQTVSTSQQAVTTAENTLNQASAQASSNNTTAQNTINTSQSGVTTSQTGANVTNASSNSQVVSAEASLTNDQAVLTQAQDNLNNATLTAPHDGVVSVINGTVGGQPGVPINGVSSTTSTTSGSTFIQIVDNTSLQVAANVNESDMANLQVGQPATFTVNAYGARTFNGTIASVSPLGQTSSNVVSYPVYINIDPNEIKSSNLLPNMTANVTITVVQHSNVLLIPVNAVNFARLASSGNPTSTTPQLLSRQQATGAVNQARQTLTTLENQNPSVANSSPVPAFVIESLGNTFVAKPVVLGLTDGTEYEVLSGLSPDETFISGIQGSTGFGTGGSGTSGGGGGGAGFAAPNAPTEPRV